MAPLYAEDSLVITAPYGRIDVFNNARLTSYTDVGGGYLVFGVTSLNGNEEMYFSIQNDKFTVNHRRPDGTWHALVLG